MKLSDPIEVPLRPRACVYRLWGEDGVCLYVGKTQVLFPEIRIGQHEQQSWWPEVARIDYVEVVRGSLAGAERAQIQELRPKYNSQHNGLADTKRLLRALDNGPLSRRDVSHLFQRHKTAGELDAIINPLLAAGTVREYTVGNGVQATRMYEFV